MGSVQDYEKCPQCGGVCYTDFETQTAEYYASCNRCGYSYSYTLKRCIRKRVVFNRDGTPVYKERESFGYGTAHEAVKNGFTRRYSFHKPYIKRYKRAFNKFLSSKYADTKESKLIIWDIKTNTLKSLYGDMPPSFDEVVAEN